MKRYGMEVITFYDEEGGQKGHSKMLDFLTSAKLGDKFNIVLREIFEPEKGELPPMVELEVISPFPTFDVKVVSKNCAVTNDFIVRTLKDFTRNIAYNPFDCFWRSFDICPENISMFSDIRRFRERRFEEEGSFDVMENHIEDYLKAQTTIKIAEDYFRRHNIYFKQLQ